MDVVDLNSSVQIHIAFNLGITKLIFILNEYNIEN
jgi:hypothetical protein